MDPIDELAVHTPDWPRCAIYQRADLPPEAVIMRSDDYELWGVMVSRVHGAQYIAGISRERSDTEFTLLDVRIRQARMALEEKANG